MDEFESVLTEAQKDAVMEYVLGDGLTPLGDLLPDWEDATAEQRDVMADVITVGLLERQAEEAADAAGETT